jgi:hypothetical protein
MSYPDPDPLEAELSAIQPVDLSPAVRQRIGHALAQPAPSRMRFVWPRRAALLIAAACIALIAWLALPHAKEGSRQKQIVQQVHDMHRDSFTTDSATLADYRRALAESPARLDSLLDAQAAVNMGSPDRSVDLRAASAEPDWIH